MSELERNKAKLKKLMRSHGKSSRHIAMLLERVTGDHLSARTFQSCSASLEKQHLYSAFIPKFVLPR